MTVCAVVDDRTVEIGLKKVYAPFISNTPLILVLNEKLIRENSKEEWRDGLSGRSLGRRRALHALILAASQMVVNRYGGCHGGWSKGQPIDEILSSSPMTKQR